MNNITSKDVMTAQELSYDTTPVESALANRSARRHDDVVRQAQPQPEDTVQTDKQALEDAAAYMQDATQVLQRNLNFSLDDSTGRLMVKVTDSSSGEVIRQMPSEEALRLAESLDEMRSLLFKAQA